MKATLKKAVNWLPMLVLGGGVAVAGSSMALKHLAESPETAKTAPIHLTVDESPLTNEGRTPRTFAPVVKKVAPSVVKVFTSTKAKGPSFGDGQEGPDMFLRRFFGEGAPSRNPNAQSHAPREHGVGSGVIVTKDGYILTNNHVVDGADEVKVGLQDGREFTGKVIGKDAKSDVAVLKINAEDLPHIDMADSDKIEVGDLVLAVGNPFGIGQTVTMGMVSAKGRATMGLDYEDFIQTDAAINPGNSGGALVDADGRLIGINTAILSRTGGNQGIGFAIPTNLARSVMESLVADGRVSRGYLGVMIQDVTPALAKQFNLKDRAGALVGDVTPKGPAEKAGVQSGDVVTEFNGKTVRDSRDFKLQVAAVKPGQKVALKVLRDGSVKNLQATLKEQPDAEKLAKSESNPAEDTGTLNGVGVADLDRNARRQFDLPESLQGAVVTDVEPDSAAREAGLQPGDVIQEINRRPVRGAQDAVKLTEKGADKTTLLRVWRNGGSHFLVVDESGRG